MNASDKSQPLSKAEEALPRNVAASDDGLALRRNAILRREERRLAATKNSAITLRHPDPQALIGTLEWVIYTGSALAVFLGFKLVGPELAFGFFLTVLAIFALRLAHVFRKTTTLQKKGGQLRWEHFRFDPEGDEVVVHHDSANEYDSNRGRTTTSSKFDVIAPVVGKGPTHILSNARESGRVRDFAEAICKLNGYQLRWKSDDGEEVRAPHELDLPLWVRVQEHPPEPVDCQRPTFFEVQDQDKVVFKPSKTANLINGMRLIVIEMQYSVEMNLKGVVLKRSLLGIPLPNQKLVGDELESLYFEDTEQGTYLVFAGTNWFRRIRFLIAPSEMAYCRYRMLLALAGLDGPKASRLSVDLEAGRSHLAASSASGPKPDALSCPRCETDALLGSEEGDLGEKECEECAGVLLSPDGAAKLFENELAISRATLMEILEYYSVKSLTCPSCKSAMYKGPIAGSEVDFCKGCGSVWLDDKELSAMTKGRRGAPHGESEA